MQCLASGNTNKPWPNLPFSYIKVALMPLHESSDITLSPVILLYCESVVWRLTYECLMQNQGNSKQIPNLTMKSKIGLWFVETMRQITNQLHSRELDISWILVQQTVLLGGSMTAVSTHHYYNRPNTEIYKATKPETFHTDPCWVFWNSCLVVEGIQGGKERPYGIKRTQVRGLSTTSGRLDWAHFDI